MELRKFITDALTDIFAAVEEAQRKIDRGKVVPDSNLRIQSISTGVTKIQPIEFEVAVTTEQHEGSEAKLSVVTAIVGGGMKGESGSDQARVATLRFRVPVELPKHPGD